MKIGIMQPYFFPYIGYWQLMNAVDKYVIYDDVNYIVRGWINRNRILINNCPHYINLPICEASRNKLINEILVNKDQKYISSVLRSIELAYKKAPFFNDVYPMIEKSFDFDGETISDYLFNTFKLINNYLDIKTELILSSSLVKDNSLKGEDKIIEICRLLNATEYYNAIGGQDLYKREHFKKYNIDLLFLKTENIEYHQFNNNFCDNLSIIDVMMFNNVENIRKMLTKYSTI